MLRNIYSALLTLIVPIALIRYWLKGYKEPKYRQNLRHRLGFLPALPTNNQQTIWIHCVSHGETQAAMPLIKSLSTQQPQKTILISTTTATGKALGERLAKQAEFGNIHSVFLPFDLTWCMQMAIRRIKPSLMIIIETELWPNLLRQLKHHQIKTLLLNGRLSNNSARRYERIKSTMQTALSAFSVIAVRDAQDAQRFVRIGATPDQISIIGNIKFDMDIAETDLTLGANWRERVNLDAQRPVWIAASTHAPEESLMLAVHRVILQSHPNALLMLVPRHPNRFDEVSALIKEMGLIGIRRSELEDIERAQTMQAQVLLGDSMGEMMAYYAAADSAVVCGSFAAIGGHNVLEPLALKKPTITGPHTHNFDVVVKTAVEAEALCQISTSSPLTQKNNKNAWVPQDIALISGTISDWIDSPESAEQYRFQASTFMLKHQGAKQRALELIDHLLDS